MGFITKQVFIVLGYAGTINPIYQSRDSKFSYDNLSNYGWVLILTYVMLVISHQSSTHQPGTNVQPSAPRRHRSGGANGGSRDGAGGDAGAPISWVYGRSTDLHGFLKWGCPLNSLNHPLNMIGVSMKQTIQLLG